MGAFDDLPDAGPFDDLPDSGEKQIPEWMKPGPVPPIGTMIMGFAPIASLSQLEAEPAWSKSLVSWMDPEQVPSGEEVSKQLGIPKWIATPSSAISKTAAGLGQFLTSPKGIQETVTAAAPLVGTAQKLKWIYDMAKGAGEAGGDLSVKVEQAIKDPSQADWQGIAEDTVNLTVMGYGAGKLGSSTAGELTGIRQPLGRILESDKTRLAKDLAVQLQQEAGVSKPAAVTPQRRLGIGPISASPFAQPGIPELADAALRERMQQVVVPGQEGAALNALRDAIEPQPSRITPVTIARADRPFTGDESVIQPTIAGLQAKPGFAKTASDVLLERKTPEVDQLIANAEAVLPAAAAEAKKGVTDARQIGQATEVYGDVRPREEPAQVVPVEGSGEGIQPQTGGGISQAQGSVGAEAGQPGLLLTPQTKGLTSGDKVANITASEKIPSGTAIGTKANRAENLAVSKSDKAIAEATLSSIRKMVEAGTLSPDSPARFRQTSGPFKDEVIVTLSSKHPGKWQATLFKDEGEGGPLVPSGDVVFDTWEKAIRSALGENIEGKPSAGSKTFIPEPPAKPSLLPQETAPVAPAPTGGIGESSKGVVEPTSTAPPPAISEATTKGEKLQLVNPPPETKLQSGVAMPEFLEPKKPTVTPEQRAQLDKALGDVYTIFEPLPKEKVPTKKRAVNIIEGVRTGFSSKFRPLNKLAEDIAKSAGKTKSQDIAGIFEQLKGSSGKGEADIYRFDREVSDLVKGEEKDFNAYMFLRRSLDRLKQDLLDLQKEMADPGSVKDLNRRQVAEYTIPELESKLKSLTSILGPNKTVTFQKAAELYNRYMDDALRLQVTSGRMSPEVYSKIRSENQFYAPFKVMRWLNEEMKPEGTGKKIDTVADYTKAMKGIEDPNFRLGDMLSAARQNLLTSRILSDKALAMQKVAALAKDDPNGLFIRKLKWDQDAPDGWETVNVYEQGKKVKYATNPDVAKAISTFSNTQATGLMARSIGAGASLFRAGATALNVPFQVSNLMADVPRAALVSKYGVRGVRDLVMYPLDFVHAIYSAMAGDVFGVKNKLYLDFLDSGVAGSTIQSYLTPKALAFREPTAISGGKRAALNVLYSPAEFAQAIEQTSKILGVKRAMRFEGVKSGKELAAQIPEAITELRRFSGSPDFGRMGSTVETAKLNLLYMFLNARIQGAVADVGRLTGRDGAKVAATTWFRTMTAVGLPTAYLYFMNQMPGNKEDYDRLPQNTKRNYWPIPKPGKKYVTNEDGERVRDYWLIPKRESSKWIADMVESGLEFAQQRDSKAFFNFAQTMIEDISPVNIQGRTAQERIESVGSSLHPFIKAPVELATGRDTYRHQAIVKGGMEKASPEKQFTDRTAEAFKTLAVAMPDVAPEFLRSPVKLENLTRNLTAGLVTQFLPRKPVEGRKGIENLPLLQRFQSIPYTDQEAFRQQYTQLEREAADEYLDRNRAAQKLLEDNKGKSLPDVVRGAGKDVKLIKQVVDLWLAKKNGATSKDRQLINLPAKQRAEFLLKELKGMPKAQRNRAILDYSKKRVLTESVFQEMGAQAGEIFK